MFRQHNSWLQSPLTDSAVTFESGSVSLSGHINNNNDYDSRKYQRPMTSSTLKHDMNGSRSSLHSRSDVTHWNGKPHIREVNGRSKNSDATSVTSREVRGVERKRGGAVNRTTRLPSSASSMISSQRTPVEHKNHRNTPVLRSTYTSIILEVNGLSEAYCCTVEPVSV